MKSFRLLSALSAAILFLSLASAAHATSVTYVFTAASGQDTSSDGSTVTISSTGASGVTDWNLISNVFPTAFTPSNSFLNTGGTTIVSFDATTWFGNFEIDSNFVSFDFYQGTNSGAPNTGTLFAFAGDPTGTWSARVPSVPDSGSTFQLMTAALVGLGVCQRWNRRVRIA